MRKRTKLVRIRVDTMKQIREAMPDIKHDPERFDWLYKTSPFRLDRWMGMKPNAKKKKR